MISARGLNAPGYGDGYLCYFRERRLADHFSRSLSAHSPCVVPNIRAEGRQMDTELRRSMLRYYDQRSAGRVADIACGSGFWLPF